MMPLHEILAIGALVIGSFFCVVGILGLIRLPDVYTRINASGKVSALGIISFLIAACLLMPELTLKAVALAVFIVMTSPVASYAIAAAARRQGVPPVGLLRDDTVIDS